MRIRVGGRRNSFASLLESYAQELKVRRASPRTRAQAAWLLPRVFAFLRERGVRDPRRVTPAGLAAYARSLREPRDPEGARLSLWSQSTYLATVRGFFAFLERRRFVFASPARELRLPRAPRLPRAQLSPVQALRLVSAPFPGDALGRRDRAILELLYGTGIRLGECTMLDITDLDLARRLLLVRDGKGRKDRIVPVPACAAQALDVYLRDARPALLRAPRLQALFLDARGKRRLERQGIQILVRRHARRAGLAGRVSPHLLRHVCATHLLRGGASVRHVQELLGHRDIATTALYTRVAIPDLREALARAHPRDKRRRGRRRRR